MAFDLSKFDAPAKSTIMPDDQFNAMFAAAGIAWEWSAKSRIRYRLPGDAADQWRDSGLRSHYRVDPDGGRCAKYETTQRALFWCLMLEDAA